MVNKESIRLYRDVLRACKHFTWKDQYGREWSEVLKKNARNEFEQARNEKDPMLVARLILTGRDCLNETQAKLMQAMKAMQDNINKTRVN